MPICLECGKKAGGFIFRAFNEATGRCDHCDKEAAAKAQLSLMRFRSRFHELLQEDGLTEKDWGLLEAIASENTLDIGLALAYVREDLQRLFARVIEIKRVTADSADDLEYLVQSLSLPKYCVEDARSFVRDRRIVAVSCVRCGAGVKGMASSFDYRCLACGVRAVMSKCRHCSTVVQIEEHFFGKGFQCPACSASLSGEEWNSCRISMGKTQETLREDQQVVADLDRRKVFGLFLGGSGYEITVGYSVLLDFIQDGVIIKRFKQRPPFESIGMTQYSDVTSLHIGGRGAIKSGGGWVGGGFGLQGIVAGALLASALNQVTIRSSIETIVYFKTIAGELIVLNNHYTPEHLRIMLSPAFTRIESAHRQPSSSSVTIVDQLHQLGELRESGTITEDEFQVLKAKLINGP